MNLQILRSFHPVICRNCVHQALNITLAKPKKGGYVSPAMQRNISVLYNKTINYYKSTKLLQRLQLPEISQRRHGSSSALFISGRDLSNVSVVEVDLDLERILTDTDNMQDNLKKRNIDINIYKLFGLYRGLKEVNEDRAQLEREKDEINRQMKTLVKLEKTPDVEAQKKILITQGREMREELKKLNLKRWELEEPMMHAALKLPNWLPANHPVEDTILEEHREIPEFNFKIRSHEKLGAKHKMLSFSDVGHSAYYLEGDLADLEVQMTQHFCDIFNSQGFQQMACPDMVKTLVVEGCGQDFTDPESVYTLELKAGDLEAFYSKTKPDERDGAVAKWDITLHLTGASPFSFAGFLTKMNLQEDCLPLRMFTTGRHYSPEGDSDSAGLLGVHQSTRVELFGASRTASECDLMFQEFLETVWKLYKELPVPLRLVQTGVAGLELYQTQRCDIQAWLPSRKQFIKVASVSQSGDFISRRLMMKYSSDIHKIHHHNYLHNVHATVLNFPPLLAALMENSQTQSGDFSLQAIR